MDASDADAPVVTPYIGSKMDAPAPPSLQRQPSPPPPQCSLNSPPATSSIPPDSSTAGTDPTKLSTAERIKLSVAALITRRDSSTPAADHFTVLPGDSPNSRTESFAVQQNNPDQHIRLDQQQHAIRHGLSSDSEKQWGMEGLLRSKAGTAGGAAADAKRKLSAHLGLSAKRGEEGGEQQQQSCEYVAMNTPCESPVASGGGVDQEDQQWGAREMDRRSSTSTHSSSSRTGLVTRLGSALQSWTSGGGGSGSKSWGGGGGATSPREGRPGPLGARYTQQAPESYSPFEPSPHHQLQKRLPVKPAFTAAGAGAGAARRGEAPASGVTAAAGRGEIEGETPEDETDVAGSEGRPAGGTPAETALPADSDGPGSLGAQQSAPQGGVAEGRNASPIDSSTGTTPSPRLPQGFSSDVRKCDLDGEGGSGANGSPITASRAAAATGSSDGVNIVENGDKPLKKVGLWELKAERSRLENALAEAESERDVEKARAWDAANRLEAAVARLEGVLQGGGVSAEGAAAGSVGGVD